MAYNVDYGIQKFYTLLQQAGLARDMQMRVTAFVINGVEQLTPESLIFVKTGAVPSKSIAVQNVAFMGTQLQIPGGVTFPNPWDITFYCTQDYNIRKLLEASMLDTFNPATSIGDIEPRDLTTYRVELSLLNDKMVPLRKYKLLGTFVSNIAPIDYDATGNGQIRQISASISYQYWEAEDVPEGGLKAVPAGRRPESPNKFTNLQNILGI
jgi:hypothetical protein